ncbi:MAG: asparagine synthase-related protein, partial [Flavobacteriales bacterium]
DFVHTPFVFLHFPIITKTGYILAVLFANNISLFILRELSKKYLPDHIINQPKRGFEIPLKQWVDGILKAKIEHYVFDADCYWKQVLNADFVTKLHKRELAISDERRAKMLYQIFALELWYKNLNN